MEPSVSIVIVNYNGMSYVRDAISSAIKQQYSGLVDVVVVDNASTDDSLGMLRRIPGIRLIESHENVGFGAGVNIGVRASDAQYVALLNPDAVADLNWLSAVLPWLVANDLALGSSQIRASDHVSFAGGGFVTTIGTSFVRTIPTSKTRWITGCAMIFDARIFRDLGGFDERFFLYGEDVDLSFRFRAAGHRIDVYPEALVDHPSDGRSTRTLGASRIDRIFFSRGRIIAKYVPTWMRPFALLYTGLAAPMRFAVSVSMTRRAFGATIAGIRSVVR